MIQRLTGKDAVSALKLGKEVGVSQTTLSLWLAHRASGPNQVWSWDITWLPTTVRGRYFHLYLVMDVWSRRIVGWAVPFFSGVRGGGLEPPRCYPLAPQAPVIDLVN
jgi:transposase InsO family protein